MIALKLAAAPLVGWLASQAGRRFGHRVAGLIGGLSAYRRADHAVPGLGRTTRPNVAVCAGLATRGAAETAAHLVDRVFAPLPVKQWGIEVSQRLRTCLQRDTALQGTLLRIFLSVTGRCLREHSPCGPAAAPIEALASIHRFGSSLNEHLHFHCCVDATGADHEDRRPGAAAACASPSLLRCAGAQCTAEVGGGGAPLPPCRQHRFPWRPALRPAIMPCRATCGPCCWRGYIRCSRCCARSATVKCASSPSSTMPALWGKFSSIAANHPSLRALRPLTGLRCGRWLPAAEPARNDQQWDQAAQARTGAGVRLAYRLVTRDFRPPLARHGRLLRVWDGQCRIDATTAGISGPDAGEGGNTSATLRGQCGKTGIDQTSSVRDSPFMRLELL